MSEKNLLQELSGDEIYQKFYTAIPQPLFKQMVSADPKTVIDGDKIIKIGQYAKLIINLYQNKQLRIEDLPAFKEYLGYVYKYQIPVDIKSIKNLSDLYDLVKDRMLKSNVSFDNALNELDPKEYKVLYNGKYWVIYYPLTQKAACYLGANTQWCTTWGEESLNPSFKDRNSYYNTYNSGSVSYQGNSTYDFSEGKADHLYILVNKADPEHTRYQFHFSTKQFMNMDDRQINIGNFLTENKEILTFFFPSLIDKKTSESDYEYARMKFLPGGYRNELLEKLRDKFADTPLISSIIDMDNDAFDNLIENNPNLVEYDLSGDIEFNVKTLSRTLDYYYDVLTNGRFDINDASNFLSEDIYQYMKDETEYLLKDSFNAYYEKNKTDLVNKYAIKSIDKLKELFYEEYLDDNGIKEAFYDDYVDINTPTYTQHIQSQVTDLENLMDITQAGSYHSYGYDIKINTFEFLQYISSHNIGTFDGKLMEVLDDYCDSVVDPPEYVDQYEYANEYPEYGKKNSESLTNKIDNFFFEGLNAIGEDEDDEDDNERNERCRALQEKLGGIVAKYFDKNYTAENEINKVQILTPFVNCQDSTVKVRVTNKQTGKYNEAPIKLDSIITYLQNYKLFEQTEHQIKLMKKLKLL